MRWTAALAILAAASAAQAAEAPAFKPVRADEDYGYLRNVADRTGFHDQHAARSMVEGNTLHELSPPEAGETRTSNLERRIPNTDMTATPPPNHPTTQLHAILDLGTGSGIGALFAARAGCLVTAVDINPEAVRCARINALMNRLEERVQVLEGDLFAPVAGRRSDRA